MVPYLVKFSDMGDDEFEEFKTTCRMLDEQSFLFLLTLTIVSRFIIVGPSYITFSSGLDLSPLSEIIY